MKKLLTLFVLLMILAVMATACTSSQDQVTTSGGMPTVLSDA